MRRIGVVIFAFLILAGALIAGGSLPALIGGATALDVKGAATPNGRPPRPYNGWGYYGGDQGGNRYSALAAITPANVGALEIAWEYRTGDQARPLDLRRQAAAEGTPILVHDKLVFCTPFNEVIALHPGTGGEIWRYDPKISVAQRPANQFVCRGVAFWKESGSDAGACAARIFTATNDSRLIALDAATGEPCRSFGENGVVRVGADTDLVWPGEFQMTSPPAVIGDVVVIGSSISDNVRVAAPSGAVRAFDARTGAMKWTFDPAPDHKHGNVWAPISVDDARGLVFLPTSSASPDFFGGLRDGDNDFTDSVVALRGETGDVVWSFQTVHHDVWDYDLPAQPGLYKVWRDGEAHDVVAQVTKTGLVFVLDRDTGAPFLPVEERRTPQDAVVGERLSPTQPFPVATPPIVPDRLAPEEAFGLTVIDRKICESEIRRLRAEGLFTPPSLEGTLIYPFNGGGANWGGAAYDETRNLLIINMSNAAHRVTLIPAGDVSAAKELHHDAEISPQTGVPFGVRRDLLLSPLSLPCTPPPWGVIAGVDLSSGAIVWRRRLGTTRDVAGGIALDLGTPNFGGPIATGGGLVFIGAAMDNYLRAFSTQTGDELWKGRLPAGGQATPMTYEWEGRQFIVIYAGGHGRMTTTLGDSIVAFALPPGD